MDDSTPSPAGGPAPQQAPAGPAPAPPPAGPGYGYAPYGTAQPQGYAYAGPTPGAAGAAVPPAYAPPPPYVPQGALPRPRIPGPGGLPMADIGARFAARLIDGVILVAAAVLFAVLTGGAGLLLATVLIGAVEAAYEITMLTRRGQTLGKMAMGIRVVGAQGQLPDARSALLRWGLPFVLQVIPVIGWVLAAGCYLSAAFDRQRRGFHDKVAGTWVVAVPGRS